MPQIIKSKRLSPKKKSSKVKKKTLSQRSKTTKKTNLALPISRTKSPKTKHSALDYYNCLLAYVNQGWRHPITGEKKKITACCKDCKANAPALNNQRDKELVKLISSYQQVGESLAKLLKPIN